MLIRLVHRLVNSLLMVLKGFVNCAKRLVNVAQWFVNDALSLANDSKGLPMLLYGL